MSGSLLYTDTKVAGPSVSSSARPSHMAGLTTFPNPFADEPEPGLLPTLLSKVKSTFTAATATSHHQSSGSGGKSIDKGPLGVALAESSLVKGQTEAQQLAEAVKSRGHARRQSGPIAIPSVSSASSASLPYDGAPSKRPSLTNAVASSSSLSRTAGPTAGGTTSIVNTHMQPPSIANYSISQAATKRLVPSGERQWRPTGAAPAQVTVSPITSVTTTVQPSTGIDNHASPRPPKVTHRAHFGLQAAVASSSRALNHHHAHSNSFGGRRPRRRSSAAIIPDSPSSVSLSAMIAANAELSQNVSHIPGFPLAQEDNRSVRSLGFVKKTHSVSRIIRRMRGEGLSKHYWMADEHCKECYDCKTVDVQAFAEECG